MVTGGQALAPARPAGRRWLWWLGITMGSIVGILALAVVGYTVATAPKTVPGHSPLTSFDPEMVGRIEQRAWAAYYLRQWPTLFDLMLRMTRSVFGLSLHQALCAAYLNTDAQIVWARQGAQGGLAEARMREFYAYVRQPAGGRYDVERAARLEVAWWQVHRDRDQYPDRSALAQALVATYAEVYQLPADRLLPAGEARAAAMDLSDQWNREGKDPNSPLLGQISDLLVQSYRALAEAVATPG